MKQVICILFVLLVSVACETQAIPEPQLVVVTVPVEITKVVIITATAPPPTSTPIYLEPTITDFQVELLITNKECFGSAGCNVYFQPDLYTDFNVKHDYLLIYEVHGGEDGPLTFNLTIHNDSTYTYSEERVSTARSSDVLTITIVRLVSK